MVKFGKSKLKALNKLDKKQKTSSANVSNKILKKKQNAEKKVTFQKEVLLKEAALSGNSLIKNVTVKEILLKDTNKKQRNNKPRPQELTKKPKIKPVEKQKKRQKTQINDTKLLLNLMNKRS
ncbi:hypothetical protein O3G_MSEX009379 [Manduca sexta]|uniref:Uncharacterized protein n=1 Tax=Manduca sexta TaxID=7130 RepID=A0A921ZEW7_MANSE|nr:hypothetical protein O3G_MSEX009379 [Manduca sexta]